MESIQDLWRHRETWADPKNQVKVMMFLGMGDKVSKLKSMYN